MSKKRVYDHMRTSSIVVVPSIWPEPFGIVALEANYLGVPVVASRVGGLSERIIDGKTGLLAEPGSPEDLAEKISKAIEINFSRERIIRLIKKRFDPDIQTKRLINFFQKY